VRISHEVILTKTLPSAFCAGQNETRIESCGGSKGDSTIFQNEIVAPAQGRAKGLQERGRSTKEIFLRRKVFNTDVDKFVEKRSATKLTCFSSTK
jgi:hypothetical protein